MALAAVARRAGACVALGEGVGHRCYEGGEAGEGEEEGGCEMHFGG